MSWTDTQEHEEQFWNNFSKNCTNTFIEDEKQIRVYATRLKLRWDGWRIPLENQSIIDIGGGPSSMLLKSHFFSKALVVDPLMNRFPQWVRDRYASAGIQTAEGRGEDFQVEEQFDEAWIYNVLQHTEDPAKVIENMKTIAKKIRIFEWVDVPADEKHPHVITAIDLDERLGKKGMTENIMHANSFTSAYYNVV